MAKENLIGTTVKSYRILRAIGRGGSATVYLARDEKLDRLAAVKMLHAFAYHPYRQRIVERFRRGAQAAARLRHANILPIYDFGEWEGTFYIVMQYVQGKTLRQILLGDAEEMQSTEPLPLLQALDIAQQVGAALDHAHQRGIVHRDVKPSNVLVADDGQIYLTDFGLAHVEDATPITKSGETLGTPHYMSPEQGQGLPVDHRSDVYSLGVVLFHMLTGQVPFDAETPAPVILKHMVEPLPSPRSINPEIPPAVEAVLRQALAKNPSERYQTVQEFIHDLEEAIVGAPTGFTEAAPPSLRAPETSEPAPLAEWSRTPSPHQKTEPPRYRNERTYWILAGAVLAGIVGLLACGVVAFFLLGGPNLLRRETATLSFVEAGTFTPTPSAVTPTPTALHPQTETAIAAATITPTVPATPTSTTQLPTATLLLPTPTAPPMTATPREAPTLTSTAAPTPTPTATPTPTSPPTATLPPISVDMILIPAGDFIQGSSDAEIDAVIQMCADAFGGICPHPRDWFADETPRRTVYLDAFYIDRWEVTNREFAAFADTTGYVTDAERKGESKTWRALYTAGRESYPVVWMSWNDADAYCQWTGRRLPTEAEWEKVARGTDGRIWPWGSNWEAGRANTGDGGAGNVAAVGSYPASASPYGAMDMTGNVWEWVADWYDPVWYASSPTRNPGGPLSGASRVLRGGSFRNPPWEVRAVHRHSGGPDGYALDHGFRCAR